MKFTRKYLLVSLAVPVLALVALTAYKRAILSIGREVTLPISGYDPRDLLAGHYLIYQIDYGVPNLCGSQNRQSGYVCLEPKMFSYTRPQDCSMLIEGICEGSAFKAGIERFYVPEEQARDLEKKIQSKEASIVLSVTSTGQVQIKDLLIDGKSWKSAQ